MRDEHQQEGKKVKEKEFNGTVTKKGEREERTAKRKKEVEQCGRVDGDSISVTVKLQL